MDHGTKEPSWPKARQRASSQVPARSAAVPDPAGLCTWDDWARKPATRPSALEYLSHMSRSTPIRLSQRRQAAGAPTDGEPLGTQQIYSGKRTRSR